MQFFYTVGYFRGLVGWFTGFGGFFNFGVFRLFRQGQGPTFPGMYAVASSERQRPPHWWPFWWDRSRVLLNSPSLVSLQNNIPIFSKVGEKQIFLFLFLAYMSPGLWSRYRLLLLLLLLLWQNWRQREAHVLIHSLHDWSSIWCWDKKNSTPLIHPITF